MSKKKVNKGKEALSQENVQLRDIVKERDARIKELESEVNALSAEKAEEAIQTSEGSHIAVSMVKVDGKFFIPVVEFSLDNNAARVIELVEAHQDSTKSYFGCQTANKILVERVLKEYM